MHTISYHPRMLKDILIEAATDGWAQAGVIGAGILAASKWIVITFGQAVGHVSSVAGLVVVLMVIVEKAIAIRMKYRQMRKDEHKDDDFDGTEMQERT